MSGRGRRFVRRRVSLHPCHGLRLRGGRIGRGGGVDGLHSAGGHGCVYHGLKESERSARTLRLGKEDTKNWREISICARTDSWVVRADCRSLFEMPDTDDCKSLEPADCAVVVTDAVATIVSADDSSLLPSGATTAMGSMTTPAGSCENESRVRAKGRELHGALSTRALFGWL